MNKARRLSVRVPAIGWEVYISRESSRNTNAKIANISADGAYLITQEQYQPDSKVNLSIKSPSISFSSAATVVRNDLYGIGVRFLDQSESTRSSLLSVISRLLIENNSTTEESPMIDESRLSLNCDL